MLHKVLLLALAGLLAVREVLHLSEPFLHNQIDTFLDIFLAVAIVLLVANAFGFRKVAWWRTVGPCLTALLVDAFVPHRFSTPGYRLAEWAQLSPWRGYQGKLSWRDVDPWLALSADLLIFTTAFSLILFVVCLMPLLGRVRVKAA